MNGGTTAPRRAPPCRPKTSGAISTFSATFPSTTTTRYRATSSSNMMIATSWADKWFRLGATNYLAPIPARPPGSKSVNDFLHIGLYNTENRVRFYHGFGRPGEFAQWRPLRFQPHPLERLVPVHLRAAGRRGTVQHQCQRAGQLRPGHGGALEPQGKPGFGPWGETEFYLSGGFDYHSNDARGTVKNWDVTTQNGGPVTQANDAALTRPWCSPRAPSSA